MAAAASTEAPSEQVALLAVIEPLLPPSDSVKPPLELALIVPMEPLEPFTVTGVFAPHPVPVTDVDEPLEVPETVQLGAGG
ncbi:MAG TPA: hypothetical protein VHO01_16045 [Jatrophihabitans sp.]|nr:hypothetical protein [Jatrophihabitans sp.]